MRLSHLTCYCRGDKLSKWMYFHNKRKGDKTMTQIKEFSDGTILEQGQGTFDDYCVYITRPEGRRYAPRDKDYFAFFIEKAKIHTPEKIYSDYVRIYDQTTSQIDDKVLADIDSISKHYQGKDTLEFNIWFSVIYLGMVAEEKKKNAVLKKRIKRLGMYQILFEKMSAEDAASFSRGKKVPELSPLCKERGF